MSKVKTKVSQKMKASSLRCGDCIHFSRGPKKYDSLCSKLGVLKERQAPSCFSPNTKTLVSRRVPIEQLGEMIQSMTGSQLRILAHVLKDAAGVKETKFSFGQLVYVSIGGDYLAHYFKAYVVGYDLKTDSLQLAARIKNTRRQTGIEVKADRVLSPADFEVHAQKLIERDRLAQNKSELMYYRWLMLPERMDKKGRVKLKVSEVLDFDAIPTIDNPPFKEEPKAETNLFEQKKPKKKKNKIDMVEFKDDSDDEFAEIDPEWIEKATKKERKRLEMKKRKSGLTTVTLTKGSKV